MWLEGLPVFAGWVLSYDKPVLLVLEDQSHLEPTVKYLIRAGFDKLIGFLKGGIESWYNAGLPTEHLELLSVHHLKDMVDREEDLLVLDTREHNEFASGHVQGAINIYVGHLEREISRVPDDKPVAVFCTVGNRASMGASILLRTGHKKVYTVLGSVKAWVAAGFPVTKD
ncbi:rhodanese-like domain-containing protein [Chloroflexota bacterium]